MARRTPEREEFLASLLSCAIENGGMGFFSVKAYRWESLPPSEAFAEIEEMNPEPGEVSEWRIDIDTMARGLGVIRNAVLRPVKGDGEAWHNAATGKRLYFGGEARRELLWADRTNGDDGDYDVIGALAVLECALFGAVVYA